MCLGLRGKEAVLVPALQELSRQRITTPHNYLGKGATLVQVIVTFLYQLSYC
jgi:hypothetical protein